MTPSITEDTKTFTVVPIATLPGQGRPCLVFIAGSRLGEIVHVDRAITIGRDAGAEIRVKDDEGISRRHLRIEPRDGSVFVEDLGSANGTFVGERKLEGNTAQLLEDGDKIRIGQATVLRFALYDAIEEAAQRAMLDGALRDPLTHAFGRRYLLQRLIAEMRFATRHTQTLGLLLIDLDQFRKVNVEHGREVGDQVLRQVASVVMAKLRSEDVLARYGGDELCVLVRATPLDGCMRLAARLREAISGALFSTETTTVHLTASIGVACFPWADALGAPSEELLAHAQTALDKAREQPGGLRSYC